MTKLFALFILFFLSDAEARVFDLNKESFASYFSIGTGTSVVDKAAFKDESTTTTTYNDGIATNPSGEFGFIYANKFISWRFGFESIRPAKLATVTATDGGATVYNIDSDVTIYTPKLGLELNFKTTGQSRVYGFGYAGQSSITVANSYTNLTIAPNADFSSTYTGTANLMGGGLGYEFAAFDTTSMTIEAGYRDLSFSNLTYSTAITNFTGSQTAGATVVDVSGAKRALNFTGAYATVGFRFYLR